MDAVGAVVDVVIVQHREEVVVSPKESGSATNVKLVKVQPSSSSKALEVSELQTEYAPFSQHTHSHVAVKNPTLEYSKGNGVKHST